MKKLLALAFVSLSLVCSADVVRLAPNFTWEGPAQSSSLRAVKGQPVVLLVAKNARVGAFKKQVKRLKDLYQEFASRKVVFAAALADGSGEVRSDIPFAIVNNGAKVAADFGVNNAFNIVVIGRDGNIDYQTDRVVPASRVRDVIVNSFAEQTERRR